MIPKPDGSQRELGIPTVLDRLIQQALLQPRIDPAFSEHGHGFRPGRRAHEAVKAARSYVQSGKRVVVDVDLAKFFDRVNHDILIARLSGRIDDAGVIRLIRAYLNAGIMDGGLVIERHLGTPQGGPLNPLLANVLLDDVDKALEARGYCFARYADDCNVYVGSRKAGERVMALLRRLYAGLKFSDQRSQERGGQRLRAQVPGLRSVGGQGQRSQMQGGRQGAGQLQGPNKATHAPLGRPQPGAGGGQAAALPVGLEGVFRPGANAWGLASAGRVVAPPTAGDPAHTVETAEDDLPGTQDAGRI
jgi:RNA-directed DNA polymerase